MGNQAIPNVLNTYRVQAVKRLKSALFIPPLGRNLLKPLDFLVIYRRMGGV
jgi:hypothetical protein